MLKIKNRKPARGLGLQGARRSIRRKAMSRIHGFCVLWAAGVVLALLVPIGSAQATAKERILHA
ncbi:MAG: hypothetical protein WBW61_12195, partial [Rhodanobacteraceae bacterium]